MGGLAYYEPRLTCNPAQIGRFRGVLSEAVVEQLLKSTSVAHAVEQVSELGAATPARGAQHSANCRQFGRAIAHLL